ncbi:MAG: pseudouridine synthase [Planctomycetota bacterium]
MPRGKGKPIRRKRIKRKTGKPAAGSGRGVPKVSKRAKRVAHGFVAASEAADSGIVSDEGMRLNRWLAGQGVDSRRKCDQRIFDGEVTVNGSAVMEPGYRVQEGDDIRVNGARVQSSRRLYYLFYKPRGVLCTNDPRETRTRLCDLVDPMVPGRVYPVGRLDEDSEGLILLTNDGDFAQMVAHPSHGVRKTYVCHVSSAVSGSDVARMREGIYMDGVKVVPEKVRIVKRMPKATSIEVTLHEGRNREVRRLLARFGYGVKRLKRVRIGSLGLQGLKRGQLRPLAVAERDALIRMAEGHEIEEPAPRRRGRR